MKRGLVLGKFAPLHKGHQFLIETGLARVDELVVLVYEARRTTDVPLATRAGWVRRLYPRAVVIEGTDAPEETGTSPEIMRKQEDYIRSVVPGPITHFFSSEWYGDHVSKALGAKDCRVDEPRSRHPISASEVRRDPWAHRAFLDPLVYRDLVRKVVFLGAESTGKTTIAEAAADDFQTLWMPEFERKYWERHKDEHGKLTRKQLLELALEHRRREDLLLPECRNFLFVDTNALTTAQFCRYYHGDCPLELESLARDAGKRYAHVFVCQTDIPYVEDGTRGGAEHRERFQQAIIEDLQRRGIPWHALTGSLKQRIQRVREVIAEQPLKTTPPHT